MNGQTMLDNIKYYIIRRKNMKKVVIIGAGPAGLTAAIELQNSKKEKYQVVVLEKSNQIGGISQTVKYKGNRMDIGGHRFFSKDDRVNKWWHEIMPMQGAAAYDDKKLGRQKSIVPGGPDPDKEDNVMLLRTRVSRIYYAKHFFDYPISMKWETIKNMGFITTMVAGFSYLGSMIHKRTEDSLENFYINRFGKKLYSMFFEGYTEKLWGRHPKKISADWGAQRVKGLSIRAVLKDMFSKVFSKKNKGEVETSLIEEYIYPKFGPGQLWEKAAFKVEANGGELVRNCEVKEIKIENNKVVSVKCLYNGKEEVVEGDIFISSMPVKDLIHGMKETNIPQQVKEAAYTLPYRDFVTVGLLVNKLKLRNETKFKTLNDIVPDCWIYVQDKGVKLGRIQIFNNWSPYMVEKPEEYVWLGLEYFCNEGDEFWNMTDDECINMAIKELVKMDVIDEEDVVDSHRERIQKAYPAYFDGYKDIEKIIEFLDKQENLFCVGRNGQHRYNNMDHSMVTAFEAVKDIENGITDRQNVWNVNTDKEYHETKSN